MKVLIRSCKVLIVAWTLMASFGKYSFAQELLWSWSGEEESDQFGSKVSSVGDVDHDGFPDLAVGAETNDEAANRAGKVYVFSGRTGKIIRTHLGLTEGAALQHSAGLGDLDGDGVDDYVIGAPLTNVDGKGLDTGVAEVCSGSDGSTIFYFEGWERDNGFGFVANAGDVDADGVSDLVIGAPAYTWYSPERLKGRVYVYSGASGLPLYEWTGEEEEDFFGTCVSTAGDVNGDGFADVLVGAELSWLGGQFKGRVYLYSGQDGSLIRTFEGGESLDVLVFCASAGDVNRDGFDDILLGAKEAGDSGEAYVYSGVSGELLFQFSGEELNSAFGYSVAGVGDANRDGYPDLLVGAPYIKAEGNDRGRAYLYSGRTGALLHRFSGESKKDRFGKSIAAAGDVNADGFADMIIGALDRDLDGVEKGAAYVFAGDDLFLELWLETTDDEQVLELNTRGGPPGADAVLSLVEVNGLSGHQWVRKGKLDSNGDWSLLMPVPPGLKGYDATFQAKAWKPGENGSEAQMIDSGRMKVSFPP